MNGLRADPADLDKEELLISRNLCHEVFSRLLTSHLLHSLVEIFIDEPASLNGHFLRPHCSLRFLWPVHFARPITA